MRTVVETPTFRKYASAIWSDLQREAFIEWIAFNPDAGSLIPGTYGCRKVRWSASGKGRRGGARTIYATASDTSIWLLIAYEKSKFDNLPSSFLAELKKELMPE